MTEMPEVKLSSSVSLSPDVLVQELQGDSVLLDLKSGVYYGLDKVGTRIWHLLGEHKAIAAAVDVMTQEFDVPGERCTGDVIALVGKLQEQGLVTVE